MSSNRSRVFSLFAGCSLIAVLVGGAGCGRLGEMDSLSKLMKLKSDTGCLNGIGAQVTKYVDGEITVKEWTGTLDCMVNSIDLFRKYVKGNDPQGYSQKDIQALIKTFIVTNTDISDELMSAIFEVKSSFIGGNRDVLTHDEVDQIYILHKLFKKESTDLIPYLAARRATPNSNTILALSDAVQRMGMNIAAGLSTEKNALFSRAALVLLLEEIGKVHGTDLDPAHVDFYLSAKAAVTGGDLSGVAGREWPALIRAATAYGGPLLVQHWMKTAELGDANESGELLLKIYKKLRVAASETLRLRNGVMPLSVIDQLIDTLPPEHLALSRGVSIRKPELKASLRPLVKKLMKSGASDQGLDAQALDTVLALFEEGTRSETHVDRIFTGLRESVAPTVFLEAADNYARSLDAVAKQEVARLKSLASDYVGLFPEGSAEIRYELSVQDNRTRNHMVRMSWIEIGARHLLKTYATGAGGVGAKPDLREIIADFQPILYSIGKFHPDVKDPGAKRFLEANLFMFASNGDEFMNLNETTYYLATVLSASSLSSRIQNRIWQLCPVIGHDKLKLETISMDCFREHFFADYQSFWDDFPELISSYRNLSADKQHLVQESIEISARRLGLNNDPISSYDIDGYAAIPHYVETLMARFDGPIKDQVLDKREILDQAFPIFKGALIGILAEKLKGKIDVTKIPDSVLEGALTYIVRFGEAPSTFWDYAHFVWWLAERPFWIVRADRAALYKVIAVLGKANAGPAVTPNTLRLASEAIPGIETSTVDPALNDANFVLPDDACYLLPTEDQVMACR
ncbi:MAG: hypothetical protein H7222_08805 [Methylotenera sp.]|nr:hypothetical protein [Oligoflexia bacterium]